MASLAEVYGSDFMKPKKRRKMKKRVSSGQDERMVPISPLEPQEMPSVLLEDDPRLRPSVKVRGLKTSVYSDEDHPYEPIQNPNIAKYEDQMDRYTSQRGRLGQTLGSDKLESVSGERCSIIDLLDDPDYMEYLEYLKAKRASNRAPSGVEGFGKEIQTDDTFHELLLFIATGFFILLLFDNIYKIGRNSY